MYLIPNYERNICQLKTFSGNLGGYGDRRGDRHVRHQEEFDYRALALAIDGNHGDARLASAEINIGLEDALAVDVLRDVVGGERHQSGGCGYTSYDRPCTHT